MFYSHFYYTFSIPFLNKFIFIKISLSLRKEVCIKKSHFNFLNLIDQNGIDHKTTTVLGKYMDQRVAKRCVFHRSLQTVSTRRETKLDYKKLKLFNRI